MPKQQAQKQSPGAVAIGEVVNSSITTLTAQCWQGQDQHGLPQPQKPNFGSFLRVESKDIGLDIISVVYNVITGPQDNVHRASALGLSREQLRLEQPHIFALLRTEVHAIIVGYLQNERVFRHLPPQPPEVHDFVFPAEPGQIRQLTDGFEFLRLLSTCSEVPADELLAASIREAHVARGGDYQFLISAGQALSSLLRSDYDRLVSVLHKIKPERSAI